MSVSYWQIIVTAFFVIINLRSLALFYLDKKRSEKKVYRISEKKLLFSAALFGGLGAWAGSQIFRHKTKKNRFRYSLPIFMFATLGAYVLLIIQ